METRQFRVEVVSKQRTIYRVPARDSESARRVAVERWQNGEPGDVGGFDWAELASAFVTETSPPTREGQDDELLLRFIRERERLLMRLGADPLDTSFSDAISGYQAAADLGWFRVGPNGDTTVDSVRATESLERLCSAGRLVCFERDRVRVGERGEIRLYCTPEYLESLSAELKPSTVSSR